MQIMQLKLAMQEENASGRKVMNVGGTIQLTSPTMQCKCQALTYMYKENKEGEY